MTTSAAPENAAMRHHGLLRTTGGYHLAVWAPRTAALSVRVLGEDRPLAMLHGPRQRQNPSRRSLRTLLVHLRHAPPHCSPSQRLPVSRRASARGGRGEERRQGRISKRRAPCGI